MKSTTSRLALCLSVGVLGVFLGVAFYSQASTATEVTSSASKAPPANSIRSVTVYLLASPLGTASLTDYLKENIATIKENGFNTIWFVTPWNDFDPNPLLEPHTYQEERFKNARETLELLRQNNMRALIGLNYLGLQWSPDFDNDGDRDENDYCDWTENPEKYEAFETYAKRFLSEVSGYADMVYPFVFTEGAEPCAMGGSHPDLPALLQKTLGSFPSRLPADLRSKFTIGYHDYTIVNLNWGGGASPIALPNPFDFISMTSYQLERQSDEEITNDFVARAARFHALYPGVPLILGEVGATSCAYYSESNQARALVAAARTARERGYGINIWGWSPAFPEDRCGRPGSGGLEITRHDGSLKPAAIALKRFFTANLPSPTITVTSPNGGETWKHEEENTISWTTNSEGTVALYLESSSGSLCDAGTALATALSKKITPSKLGCSPGTYKVLAVLSAHGGNDEEAAPRDTSDGYFTIVGKAATPPKIIITKAGVTTSYSPWMVWVVAGGLRNGLEVELYDQGKVWGKAIPLAVSPDAAIASFSLPTNTAPSGCNATSSCEALFQIIDPASKQLSNKYPVVLPVVSPLAPTAPVITKAGLAPSYSPWAVWIQGTSFTREAQVKIYDQGAQWGNTINPVFSADLKGMTLSLPSNTPPSKCNANSTCVIMIQVVDPKGGASNKYPVTLPSATDALKVADVTGFHNGNEGGQDSSECTAYGWANDPGGGGPVSIRISANGSIVRNATANVGFNENLSDVLMADKSYTIKVEAKDNQTGTWAPLHWTGRAMTCGSTSLPPPPSAASPEITKAGVTTSYQPWAVWVSGTSIHKGLRIKVTDQGVQWGDLITPVFGADLSGVTFQLPANTPPSKCNVTSSCTLRIQFVDPASGTSSNQYDLTLPTATSLTANLFNAVQNIWNWIVD